MADPMRTDPFGMAPRQHDLFAAPAPMRTDPFGLAPRQHDLFGAPEPLLDAPMTPDDIRRESERTLATLREADAMPWATQHMLEVVVMFPDLARRLPRDEAERLTGEFEGEMKRLRGAG